MSDNKNERIECFISVAACLHNCGSIIDQFIYDTTELLSRNYTNYEIVLIDNRSTDNTTANVEKLLEKVPNLRLIQLSQQYDTDTVYTAAIQTAIGDFVVLIQAGIDPIEHIPDMIHAARKGTDIVIGVSETKPNIGYRIMRKIFRLAFGKIIDYNVPSNYTGLTVISRRAVNALTNYNCRSKSLFVRMTQIGFGYKAFTYATKNKSSIFHRSLLGGIQEATKLLVFNSFAPLRIVSMVGFFGSLCSLLASVYAVVIRLFKDNVIEGWTTLMLLVSGLFTIIFIILAFQSEYMARLLEEQYQRSEYFVVSEKHSSVMVDVSRLNVLEESVNDDINAVQTGRDR